MTESSQYSKSSEGDTTRLPRNKRVKGRVVKSKVPDTQHLESERFASYRDITKHIKRKHLQNLVLSTMITCNVCDKKFAEVMHFQRHANDSHSTVTGPLWCAVSS
ncbi:hypothetical protein NUU61_009344 [Penicillium alfredii]|uniref:C2H2-type domain-containing protein n=1 Tax=Penicillium alfredii TaxID=1506179 RepID=A0A9W9JX64_9EURO|nr:uncharacterized protein NUU61_009344 [Penicillium alfredii]KAJ5084765.1 hypothetical protein NUU61_009344 [Penicillium alfredii]